MRIVKSRKILGCEKDFFDALRFRAYSKKKISHTPGFSLTRNECTSGEGLYSREKIATFAIQIIPVLLVDFIYILVYNIKE